MMGLFHYVLLPVVPSIVASTTVFASFPPDTAKYVPFVTCLSSTYSVNSSELFCSTLVLPALCFQLILPSLLRCISNDYTALIKLVTCLALRSLATTQRTEFSLNFAFALTFLLISLSVLSKWYACIHLSLFIHFHKSVLHPEPPGILSNHYCDHKQDMQHRKWKWWWKSKSIVVWSTKQPDYALPKAPTHNIVHLIWPLRFTKHRSV